MSTQITNTAPLIIGEAPNQKRLTRRFDGKTKDFKDKQEQRFYKRMLKAYCKGFSFFGFGKHDNGQTVYHKIEQSFFYQ